MSDSIQFQGSYRGVDLVILPHLVTFFLEHAVYELDTTPGTRGNVLFDEDTLSIVHGVLVPVVCELLRNAQSEVRVVETNTDKVLGHGVSFL